MCSEVCHRGLAKSAGVDSCNALDEALLQMRFGQQMVLGGTEESHPVNAKVAGSSAARTLSPAGTGSEQQGLQAGPLELTQRLGLC